MEFIYEYGLFLAKTVTFVLAFAVIIVLIVGAAASKSKPNKAELNFTDLTEQYRQRVEQMQKKLLNKKQFKSWQKQQSNIGETLNKRLYVVDFTGSMDAKEVEALREEVTAILSVATPEDEVLLRLESGGGVVHGYGLAASQLDRLRQQNIPLTVAVDKVAASGGYMMACIGSKLIAAPFAIIGSIGVIAQLPNFHKLLQKHDVDFEQFTAGEFKRTVTLFAKNTESGRAKFQQELEQTHQLFKGFVQDHRSQLNIDKVATGEHWFGYQALELNLVDTLQTSDDYLLSQLATRHIFQVKFQLKKGIAEKIGIGSAGILAIWWQKLAQMTRLY
ncbi:protease SohB [Rheinheimera sp. WS51]|uniref:protease SohB n=1 Tax=Rheinheimera sp. WS51 TaxID=3425886 RepID=UPI003D8FD532